MECALRLKLSVKANNGTETARITLRRFTINTVMNGYEYSV